MKCHKCGQEITYLLQYETGEWHAPYLKGGVVDYEREWFEATDTPKWVCPQCVAIIATEPEDADAVLRGEYDD